MARDARILSRLLTSLVLSILMLGFSQMGEAQSSLPDCSSCDPVAIADKHFQNQLRKIRNDAEEEIKALKLKHATRLQFMQFVQQQLDKEKEQLELLNKTDWKAVGMFSVDIMLGYLDIYKFGAGSKVRGVVCAAKTLSVVEKMYHYKKIADMGKYETFIARHLITNLQKNYWGVKLLEKSVKLSSLFVTEGEWTDKAQKEVIGLAPVWGSFWDAGRIADAQVFDKRHAAIALTESINAKAKLIQTVQAEAKGILARIKKTRNDTTMQIDALTREYIKNERPKQRCIPKRKKR